MGHGKPGQPDLRRRTPSGRAFVPNLPARTGRRARERGNRGRMVVRFDLHDQVRGFNLLAVMAGIHAGHPPRGTMPFHHRCVVRVGGQHAVGRVGVGVPDHREQGLRRRPAVDQPVGVEHLVPAVFGVRLREHHQFHVRGVAAHGGELLREIVDLAVGQRQPKRPVAVHQRLCTLAQHIHRGQRFRAAAGEQRGLPGRVGYHGLGHAVMEQRQQSLGFRVIQVPAQPKTVGSAPFQPLQRQAADPGYFRGLGSPRRDGSDSRNHHQLEVARRRFRRHAVGEQRIQHGPFPVRERARAEREVKETDRHARNGIHA